MYARDSQREEERRRDFHLVFSSRHMLRLIWDLIKIRDSLSVLLNPIQFKAFRLRYKKEHGTRQLSLSPELWEKKRQSFLHKGLIVLLLLMNNENPSEKSLCLSSQDVPAVGGGPAEGKGENLLLIPSESESELWKEPRPSFLCFADVSVQRCVRRTGGTADVPTGCSRKLVCFNPCRIALTGSCCRSGWITVTFTGTQRASDLKTTKKSTELPEINCHSKPAHKHICMFLESFKFISMVEFSTWGDDDWLLLLLLFIFFYFTCLVFVCLWLIGRKCILVAPKFPACERKVPNEGFLSMWTSECYIRFFIFFNCLEHIAAVEEKN